MIAHQKRLIPRWLAWSPRFLRQRLLIRAIRRRYPGWHAMIARRAIGFSCSRDGDLIELSALFEQFEESEFEFLRQQTALKRLRLRYCRGITNNVLRRLENSRSLEVLHLSGTSVSAYGLKYLSCDSALLALDLSETATGLSSLEDLQDTNGKEVDRPLAEEFRTAGLCHITRFQKLREFDLDSTTVGDAGLEQISRLRDLTRLSLIGTRITDQGLQHLHGHPSLQLLMIANCSGVTEGGISAIQENSPQEIQII